MIDDETQRLLRARLGEISKMTERQLDVVHKSAIPSRTLDLIRDQTSVSRLVSPWKPTGLLGSDWRRTMDRLGIGELTGMSAGFPPLQFDTASWFKDVVSPSLVSDAVSGLASFQIAPLGEQLASISKAAASFDFGARFAEQLFEPLRALQELFEGYEEDEQRLLAEIVPRGWLISPSMGIHVIRALARELDARSPDDFDAALVGYFDTDRCGEILSGLYDDPMFAAVRPLLDEGLEAHRRGLYRPAILVWLAAIDGIAEERYGVRRIFSVVKKKNGARVKLTIEQSTGESAPIQDALVEIVKQASMLHPADHLPKRDLVMHGRDPNFGNEKASIQLLLVLEVMHHCAPTIVSSEAVAASGAPANDGVCPVSWRHRSRWARGAASATG